MFADQQQLTHWEPQQWAVADDWRGTVTGFFQSTVGSRLGDFLAERIRDGAVVYPRQPLRALELTPCASVRVLIVGQDPYHGPGQADGLAFSAATGVKCPPSLRNIHAEIGVERRSWPTLAGDVPSAVTPVHGDLTDWAHQGVLLLNATLSVEQGSPGSHANKGWEVLTDVIIKQLLEGDQPLVCMLWGLQAQKKCALLERGAGRSRLLVLKANHPSPLSARRPPTPFLGCGHFAAANVFLRQHGSPAIRW